MKRNYKVKNRANKIATCAEVNTAARAKEVSFIMVAKGVLAFRESAHLIKVAEDTDCIISIASGKKYGTLKKSKIYTSARKFDQFGDWYLIKNRKLTKRIFTGKDREAADQFYYDVR